MKTIRVGVMALVLVSGAALGEAAHPPSYYENTADKIIPADGPPAFGSWRGKAIWYAEGECAAYYRNFSKNEDAENHADGLEQSAFTHLLADRKMKPNDIADYIVEAERGPMKDRMEVASISQGPAAIERRCDALGKAYVEGW